MDLYMAIIACWSRTAFINQTTETVWFMNEMLLMFSLKKPSIHSDAVK